MGIIEKLVTLKGRLTKNSRGRNGPSSRQAVSLSMQFCIFSVSQFSHLYSGAVIRDAVRMKRDH